MNAKSFTAVPLVLALCAPTAWAWQDSRNQPTPAMIRTMVEYKLIQEKIQKGDGIRVTVEDGTAHLEGAVDSVAQIRRAEKLAYSVPGVQAVRNELRVDMRGDMPDERVASAIASAIRSSVWFDIFDWVEGEVNQGSVTLRGYVREPWRKGEYGQIVEGLKGVAKVDNQIKALPVSTFDDNLRIAIAQGIYGSPQFVRYANRSLPPIHIVVDGGRVILEGAVNSALEKQVAGVIANQTQAFGVTNNLKVDQQR